MLAKSEFYSQNNRSSQILPKISEFNGGGVGGDGGGSGDKKNVGRKKLQITVLRRGGIS